MLDLDERGLVDLAERTGFTDIRLQLRIEVKNQKPRSWESYLRTVPNPRVPSLGEAIEQALDPRSATSSQPASARWSSRDKAAGDRPSHTCRQRNKTPG